MELKKAAAICLIAMFAAALVVLIARALDMQAAAKIQPELQKIAKELEAIRGQISGGAVQYAEGRAAGLSDGVVVYYAHSNTRCPTCRKIESQAHEAVTSGFADELQAGSVAWEIVNYEEPAGKRFVEEYGVQVPTVVLVRMEGGKPADWKRLDRVWGLVGDKRPFIEYVQAEIRAMQGVKEPQSAQPQVDLPVPQAGDTNGSMPLPIPSPEIQTADETEPESKKK